MSPLNFRTKPSVPDSAQDLSDDAFIWASQNIGGRDAVEEFVSCGVWPLCAGIDFEQVKVDLTPVSQLKVPLPHFPLRHENEEGDLQFMARVEQGTRNIVGGYTCMEHEACIASLLNNGCLNHVLKVVGVGYGPCPVPVSTEVLKKRKADAAAKVLAKRPKLVEKKSAGLVKVSGSCGGGGSKRPSGTGILSAKAVKLSKGTIPHTVASAVAMRIMPEKCISKVSAGASGAKGSERCPSSKTVPGRSFLPPLRSASFRPSGLLLLYHWMVLRNLHQMTEHPRFSRRRVLEARRWSLKLDLLQYRGRDLPLKFLLVSLLPLVSLELRQVAFRFLRNVAFIK
jgi:hypothetical protein